MEMPNEYDQVIRGGLKLKKNKKKKSKKKKKKREREKNEDAGDESPKKAKTDPFEGMTESQKKFEKKRLENEAAQIAKIASKSHRERINDFNLHLASLTEHNDVPKVGNAGMG